MPETPDFDQIALRITGVWDDGRNAPAASCQAEPCAWCGGCSTCQDFHFYEPGRGCTDETCPFLKPAKG